MDAIFRRLLDGNFSELPGLSLNATLPLPERLANELLQASLAGNQNIESCTVAIAPHNRISLHIKTRLWPWPFHLKLKLFGKVDFSGSPKVRAFLENNILLGRLGALVKALPEGVMLYEDQVSVDIGLLLKTAEQKRLLKLIRSADIRTEEHLLILDLQMRS